jgi:hypothetical protein
MQENEGDLALVEADVARLIQDEGLTRMRLETFAPNIMRLYGTKPSSFVEDRLMQVMASMEGQEKYSRALASALGIGYDRDLESLTIRRGWLKTKPDFDVSEDTLRRWEKKAMRPFARAIIEDARKEQSEPWTDRDSIRYLEEKLDLLVDRVHRLEVRVEGHGQWISSRIDVPDS